MSARLRPLAEVTDEAMAVWIRELGVTGRGAGGG